MLYTLKSARRLLAESTNAYGQTDLRDLVNRAIATLAGMKGWERLRKVLRFPCIGPRFFLPQGCAGLVRACVNGRPATVRAQDFSFIHSGPGDIARPPSGFMPVRAANVRDAGMEPVMTEPVAPCRLGAWSPSGGGVLHVRYIAPDGRYARMDLGVNRDPVYDSSGNLVDGVPIAYGQDRGSSEEDESSPEEHPVWNPAEAQCVTEVVLDLPEGYGEYVTLYASDAAKGFVYPLATYNPEVAVPTFRHYDISEIPPGRPVEVLAEVRLEPLPLVKDTDVLPFENIAPVEWVIRGDWYMKSNEPDTAQKYYSMAAQWLQAQEVVDTTIQTSLVVNSSFVNSPGEISLESENI